MADLKHQPVQHNHAEFLARAKQRPDFTQAYDELAFAYAQANQTIKTSTKELSDEEKRL